MGEKAARRLLEKRLYLELQMFKYSILRKTKREIYDSSYKIELLVTISDILLDKIQQIDEDRISQLLWFPEGILEWLYQEWLKKDDSSYEELKAHICSELEVFLGEDNGRNRKEKTDGKRVYKTA